MATSIKLFQSVRKFYQNIGIYPSQPNQNCSPNAKNILIFSSLILLGILSSAFFLFQAKSIGEYGFSFYTSISELNIAVVVTLLALEMPKLLNLIDGMEQFITRSKQIDV